MGPPGPPGPPGLQGQRGIPGERGRDGDRGSNVRNPKVTTLNLRPLTIALRNALGKFLITNLMKQIKKRTRYKKWKTIII